MQYTTYKAQTTYTLSANDFFNLVNVGIEISADELTPLAFSKTKFFQRARYGLFVEIVGESSVLYTVRKLTDNGYADIIERDSCYEAIQDIWAIYANG